METKSALLNAFIEYGLPILATGMFLFLKWALWKWAQKLSTETQTTKAAHLWQKVNGIMMAIVLDLEKTMKPALQDAAKDGSLTRDDGKKLREAALAAFGMYMGAQGKKDITDILGIAVPNLEAFTGNLLESAVARIPVVIGQTFMTHESTVTHEVAAPTPVVPAAGGATSHP
jgi:hypothetical protein